MEKTKLFNLLSNPTYLSEVESASIDEINALFPYFQSTQILAALKAHQENDLHAHNKLKHASVHSHDRKMLKFWINKIESAHTPSSFEHPVPITEDDLNEVSYAETKVETHQDPTPELTSLEAEAEALEATVENALTDDLLHHAITMSVAYNIDDIVEEETFEATSFNDKDEEALIDTPLPNETSTETDNKSYSAKLSALAKGINEKRSHDQADLENKLLAQKRAKSKKLIDTFIAKNPTSIKINEHQTDHPTATGLGKESESDDSAMVSETLAKIYAAQGNLQKAISTYEKLMLLNPKKKTYFAELIENLKKKE